MYPIQSDPSLSTGLSVTIVHGCRAQFHGGAESRGCALAEKVAVTAVLSSLLLVGTAGILSAQAEKPGAAEGQEGEAPKVRRAPATEGEEERDRKNKEFLGVKLGVAFGAVYFPDRVEEAEIVGGKVVVTKEASGRPAVLLEAHRFLDVRAGARQKAPSERLGFVNLEKVTFGLGPFVAIQSSQNEVIDAFGLGLMGGIRAGESSDSFNIGIGAMLAPSVKTLAEGLVDGQPPPPGAEAVLFKEQSRLGVVLLVSFAF